MLNKKVLLGALVAGAMVLPMTASAGVVTGECTKCHTMHNSQNGVNMNGTNTPNAALLANGGCEGCHAAGTNIAGTGRSGAGLSFTPQVHDATNPNLAGFFTISQNVDADDVKNHNVFGDLSGQAQDGPLTGTAPGGTSTNKTCAGCHTKATGGHHGAGGANNYRMLFATGTSDMIADSLYGSTPASDGTVTTARTLYDSDEMNLVCGTCHPDFHGNDGGLGQVDTGVSPMAWIRHPTDLRLADQVALTTDTYDYWNNYVVNADTDAKKSIVPLGYSSTILFSGTDSDASAGTAAILGNGSTLMCITCHFSHGSANPDLLRFAYNDGTNTEAGDNTMSPGCEYCHSYNNTALNQQGM